MTCLNRQLPETILKLRGNMFPLPYKYKEFFFLTEIVFHYQREPCTTERLPRSTSFLALLSPLAISTCQTLKRVYQSRRALDVPRRSVTAYTFRSSHDLTLFQFNLIANYRWENTEWIS